LWGLCGFAVAFSRSGHHQNAKPTHYLTNFSSFFWPVGCILFIFVVKCSLLTIQLTQTKSLNLFALLWILNLAVENAHEQLNLNRNPWIWSGWGCPVSQLASWSVITLAPANWRIKSSKCKWGVLGHALIAQFANYCDFFKIRKTFFRAFLFWYQERFFSNK